MNYWVKMTLKSYFQGNILLFDFYFKGFDKIKALPKWMRNPDVLIQVCTGKSMSEALIFASTNPQYDNRLFIELPLQYMKIPSSEHGENMLCTQISFCFDNRSNLCTHVLPMC